MRKGYAVAFVALTAGLTVAFLWKSPEKGPSPCISRNFFGLACPGCGMTRSVTAAAHGDFAKAFRFHALGPLVLAAGMAAWALLGASLVAGRDCLPDFNRRGWTFVIVGFFVVLILYWVVRLATGTTP